MYSCIKMRAHKSLFIDYIIETDRWELRESIKLSREIFAQKAFDEFRDGETEPGDNAVTDEQLDAFVREKADSAYHPSCTCKMGDPDKDNMAVVDPTTKVIGRSNTCLISYKRLKKIIALLFILNKYSLILGLDNLRVVDASIMPSVASGNLNAPTIMIVSTFQTV